MIQVVYFQYVIKSRYLDQPSEITGPLDFSEIFLWPVEVLSFDLAYSWLGHFGTFWSFSHWKSPTGYPVTSCGAKVGKRFLSDPGCITSHDEASNDQQEDIQRLVSCF